MSSNYEYPQTSSAGSGFVLLLPAGIRQQQVVQTQPQVVVLPKQLQQEPVVPRTSHLLTTTTHGSMSSMSGNTNLIADCPLPRYNPHDSLLKHYQEALVDHHPVLPGSTGTASSSSTSSSTGPGSTRTPPVSGNSLGGGYQEVHGSTTGMKNQQEQQQQQQQRDAMRWETSFVGGSSPLFTDKELQQQERQAADDDNHNYSHQKGRRTFQVVDDELIVQYANSLPTAASLVEALEQQEELFGGGPRKFQRLPEGTSRK